MRFNRENSSIVGSSNFIPGQTSETLNAKSQDMNDALPNFVVSRNEYQAQLRELYSLKAKKIYLTRTLLNAITSQLHENSLLISPSGWWKTREIELLRCEYSSLLFSEHTDSI
jgi:hypothetical protein